MSTSNIEYDIILLRIKLSSELIDVNLDPSKRPIMIREEEDFIDVVEVIADAKINTRCILWNL
jgi:DNA mismatch repair ATPase MutL